MNRPIVAAAGLMGALGVAVAAAASHGANDMLAIAGNFLLFHAGALVAIGLLPGRISAGGGAVLVAGTALFAGDLAMRGLADRSLFPFAAPAGGILMILGWLAVASAALLPPRG